MSKFDDHMKKAEASALQLAQKRAQAYAGGSQEDLWRSGQVNEYRAPKESSKAKNHTQKVPPKPAENYYGQRIFPTPVPPASVSALELAERNAKLKQDILARLDESQLTKQIKQVTSTADALAIYRESQARKYRNDSTDRLYREC